MARDGQAVNSQAADWLAKLQRADVSAVEREALDRWLDEDPAHGVAFARAEFAWERAERLRALPVHERERSGVSMWLDTSRKLSLWPIAAGLAVAAIGAALWLLSMRDLVYATDLGERRTISLEEGSQVNLNTSSRLEIDFDSRIRTARLVQGEALFKVAHDPQRPFVVKAGGTSVRAIGTAFNVRVHDHVVEVTVTEGAVAVDDKDRVVAGSAVVAMQGAVNRVSLTEDALKRRVAWREGVIELKGETLEQAVEEFNRYRKGKIVVADPAIAALRVGGRFETDEAGKFVNALKANFAIRAVDAEDGGVVLLAPEKP